MSSFAAEYFMMMNNKGNLVMQVDEKSYLEVIRDIAQKAQNNACPIVIDLKSKEALAETVEQFLNFGHNLTTDKINDGYIFFDKHGEFGICAKDDPIAKTAVFVTGTPHACHLLMGRM